MKKIMMIALMALATLGVNAQNEAGKMAVGVNLNYGMNSDYKNLGFGAKFQYNITEQFRGEASGNYFLKKDNCTMWDASVNVHYVVPIGDKLNVYPLAGVTVLGVKVEVPDAIKQAAAAGGVSVPDVSDTNFGVNVGAGIEYFLSDSFKVNAEVKYQYVKDFDRPVISIGAAYVF